MGVETVSYGAWFLRGYRQQMAGTLGLSLALADLDNLGWTIRSYKYELDYNGFGSQMKLDSPTFGDAMHNRVMAFQTARGLTADGVIGPLTGKALVERRIRNVAASYLLPVAAVDGVIRHESAYDIGAIGYVDHNDRGLTQQHVYFAGTITLSQAIRPALAVPRLAAQLARLDAVWGLTAAVASWNIGEGGAEWWWREGEPTTGSPAWWNADADGDLSDRATKYVAAVLG